jgi:hypothetical protein
MQEPNGDSTLRRFAVLVRHCFRQFFDNEALAPQAGNETALAQLFGLLAVPPAFFTLLSRPFGMSGWSHISLRYFFVCYSMTIIAFVVVLKWDTLLPDRRDYLILTPLPLRSHTVFLARVTALALFAGAFLIVLNFFGILFWPGIDGRPDLLHSLGIHALIILASGLFAALWAATIQGVLMTVFSGAWLRRVSATVQTALLAVLVMVLLLIPLMGPSLRYLTRSDSALLHWFPVYWFIGLYEQLRPSTHDPVLLQVGSNALPALGITALLFVLTYVPGYLRHSRYSMDAPQSNPAGPGPLRVAWHSLLHQTLLTNPTERAVFHFIGHTMSRSMKHRIFLAAYGGLGAALAVFSFASGRAGLLELPLTLSFILVSGLRAAFNFPSELSANWTFQVSERRGVSHCAAATRKWILISAVTPLFLLLAPLQFALYPWYSSLYRTAFGLLLSAVLIEVMFFDFRKVPFTCAYFPGKVNLVGLSVLYVFGFTAYSSMMTRVQEALLKFPLAAVAFLAVLTLLYVLLSRAAGRHMERQGRLDFDAGDPAIRTLDLRVVE